MTSNKIDIYTDGSCIGNPGPGGWGTIILIGDQEIELSGSEPDSTNNRMEMMAMIKALEWIRSESGISHDKINQYKITIHSDSNLIVQTLNQGWKRKANTDLWAEMDRLRAWLDITWTWVKAHANNALNNRADELANSAAREQS